MCDIISDSICAYNKAAIYINKDKTGFAIFDINNLDGTSGWILKMIYKILWNSFTLWKKEQGRLKIFKTTLMLD